MMDVRVKFSILAMEELGVVPDGLYAAFQAHFGVTSDVQVYALLSVCPVKVRAWIRESAE